MEKQDAALLPASFIIASQASMMTTQTAAVYQRPAPGQTSFIAETNDIVVKNALQILFGSLKFITDGEYETKKKSKNYVYSLVRVYSLESQLHLGISSGNWPVIEFPDLRFFYAVRSGTKADTLLVFIGFKHYALRSSMGRAIDQLLNTMTGKIARTGSLKGATPENYIDYYSAVEARLNAYAGNHYFNKLIFLADTSLLSVAPAQTILMQKNTFIKDFMIKTMKAQYSSVFTTSGICPEYDAINQLSPQAKVAKTRMEGFKSIFDCTFQACFMHCRVLLGDTVALQAELKKGMAYQIGLVTRNEAEQLATQPQLNQALSQELYSTMDKTFMLNFFRADGPDLGQDIIHPHALLHSTLTWSHLDQVSSVDLCHFDGELIAVFFMLANWMRQTILTPDLQLNNNNACLLLWGAPGSGKTMLTAMLSEMLNGRNLMLKTAGGFENPDIAKASILVKEEIEFKILQEEAHKVLLDITAGYPIDVKNQHPMTTSKYTPILMNKNSNPYEEIMAQAHYKEESAIMGTWRKIYMIPIASKHTTLYPEFHSSRQRLPAWYTPEMIDDAERNSQAFHSQGTRNKSYFKTLLAMALLDSPTANLITYEIAALETVYSGVLQSFLSTTFAAFLIDCHSELHTYTAPLLALQHDAMAQARARVDAKQMLRTAAAQINNLMDDWIYRTLEQHHKADLIATIYGRALIPRYLNKIQILSHSCFTNLKTYADLHDSGLLNASVNEFLERSQLEAPADLLFSDSGDYSEQSETAKLDPYGEYLITPAKGTLRKPRSTQGSALKLDYVGLDELVTMLDNENKPLNQEDELLFDEMDDQLEDLVAQLQWINPQPIKLPPPMTFIQTRSRASAQKQPSTTTTPPTYLISNPYDSTPQTTLGKRRARDHSQDEEEKETNQSAIKGPAKRQKTMRQDEADSSSQNFTTTALHSELFLQRGSGWD